MTRPNKGMKLTRPGQLQSPAGDSRCSADAEGAGKGGRRVIEERTRPTRISARALASLALCSGGAWLVPSGVALHFASHRGTTVWSHVFMSMHNAASVAFLAGAAVHIILNWKALTHYVQAKIGDAARYRREILIAVVGVSGFVLLVASHGLHVE